MRGVICYTLEVDGFPVVATFLEAEHGTPVGFVATLADGPNLTISAPREPSEPEEAVQLVRRGKQLYIRNPAHPLIVQAR